MDIVTLLTPERISLNQEVSSPKRAFEILAELLVEGHPQLNIDALFDAFVAREKLGSTALGNGIAIPHARMDVSHPCAALIYSREGLKMDAPDRKPVHLLLGFIVPKTATNTAVYSAMMAGLTLTFMRNNLCHHIATYQDPHDVIAYLTTLFPHNLAA